MDKTYNYHFTPPKGWMNDPNGMIYVDGVYHLFYQHYPEDIVWGPMHWGHAASTDLLHWEHKPIAIFPTKEEYIFSGSCVYDKENVSGLGTKENPPLLAFYTGHHPVTGEEQQCIAYSTDFENFTKYEKNPVIENRKFSVGAEAQENPEFKKDFRDPKVFPNPILGGFSMVLAAGYQLEFYHSMNLLSWEKTGEFAPKEGFTEICECPDCFPMETAEGTKWILILSLTSHVMPYYVGMFDGKSFVEEAEVSGKFIDTGKQRTFKEMLLLDYAADNYAMVSFANSKELLMLGWGESWDYVAQTAAENYRGKMTIVRRAELVKTDGIWRLKLIPVLDKTMQPEPLFPVQETENFNLWQGKIKENETVRFLTGQDKELTISVTEDEIFVDRSNAGDMSFSEFLQTKAVRFFAKRVKKGSSSFTILQDNGYFEIFAEDGFAVFSVMTY